MKGINLLDNYVPEVSDSKEQIRQMVRAINRIIGEQVPNVQNVQSTTYTINKGDDIVVCDATTSGVTITLLEAKDFPHADLLIVKTDATTTSAMILCSGSDSFGDATTSKSITTRGQSIRLVNNGTDKWFTRRGS